MWFIMAYNALDGFHRGAFQDLSGLFYAGPAKNECQSWVPLLSEAKGFDSMEAAQDWAYTIWGTRFVDRTFIFLKGPGEIDDEDCRKILDMRDGVSSMLARRIATRNALITMAESSEPEDFGLTLREKQIIKIMSEDND